MKWSPEQDRALTQVAQWMNDPSQQLFRLFGYAGTGKTTLAKHFAENVSGKVLFGAYTGKAAHVLRTKGCGDASTIHSMIYHAKEKGRARLKELEEQLALLLVELGEPNSENKRVLDLRRLIDEEKKALSRPAFALNPDSIVRQAKLVIIDECSMVDEQMGRDLLSFGAKILVLGDPAQLPPVASSGFFTEGVRPDIMLSEIHRQARDNPIIDLATRVRNREFLPLGQYGSSSVVTRDRVSPEDALAADQILVGKNITRQGSNRRIRSLKGLNDPLPVVGDKLVCLRNNHDKGLLNGAIWHVEEVGDRGDDRICLGLQPDEGKLSQPIMVESHSHHFEGRGSDLAWWERKEAEEFDYGYALTVHKAQGSQWDKVMLFDESDVFKADRHRWLYTGITRAAESVQIVRL